MRRLRLLSFSLLLSLGADVFAAADAPGSSFKVLMAHDPSDEAAASVQVGMPVGPGIEASLKRHISFSSTTLLTDVMRASRTSENDVLIGPPSVTASAISHGYQLLALNDATARFAIVARADIANLEGLRGKVLYLTQQDSSRAYLAKGLLRESKFDLKTLGKLTYGRTSGAGLLGLSLKIADATFVEENEAKQWMRVNPNLGHILKTSRDVPSGMAISVKKTMTETDRAALLRWVASPASREVGLGQLREATTADKDLYKYIAGLGILTPAMLTGTTVATAQAVTQLMAAGATAVDTRTRKEFDKEHIPGAVFAPYVEKSLKEVEYDQTQDDFTAILKLPRDKPVIFLCNGPECWKSYKASKVAAGNGFKKAYWFRGGMPEWREKSLPVTGA